MLGCQPETGEMSEPLGFSIMPGSYPNGNLYEQKSNHFRDLGPQSLLNLMSISLKFPESQAGRRKRHLEIRGIRLWISDADSISKPPFQTPAGHLPAAYSATAATGWNPSGVARPGWEGGRGLNEQKPPLLPHADEELAAAPGSSPLGSRAT